MIIAKAFKNNKQGQIRVNIPKKFGFKDGDYVYIKKIEEKDLEAHLS